MQRGRNREACFFAEEDYLAYRYWIGEALRETECRLRRSSSLAPFLARAQDVSPETHGATLIRLIREHRQELQEGALLTYDTQRSRLRLLPLR